MWFQSMKIALLAKNEKHVFKKFGAKIAVDMQLIGIKSSFLSVMVFVNARWYE